MVILISIAVISQDFKVHVDFESYVILGNDALLKCDIPSFVSDLVDIFGWIDNEGTEYLANSFNSGTLIFVLDTFFKNGRKTPKIISQSPWIIGIKFVCLLG